MHTSADRIYLDSSAIVKLIIRESETDAMVRYLGTRSHAIACALVRVEVVRAVRPHGPTYVTAARATLGSIYLVKINDVLLDVAAEIGPLVLRTLDAIHLAAAWRFQPRVEVVTYDVRMRDAAQAIGMTVVSPGR